jgi:hypothetical protein
LLGSAIVSPIVMSSMPARQTMSPRPPLDLDALQAVEGEELGDLRLLRRPSSFSTAPDRSADGAVEDAADGDAPR